VAVDFSLLRMYYSDWKDWIGILSMADIRFAFVFCCVGWCILRGGFLSYPFLCFRANTLICITPLIYRRKVTGLTGV